MRVPKARELGLCKVCIYDNVGCSYLYDGCGYVNIGAMNNLKLDLGLIEEKYPRLAKAVRDCIYTVAEYYK